MEAYWTGMLRVSDQSTEALGQAIRTSGAWSQTMC
jgi:hypothetical protein